MKRAAAQVAWRTVRRGGKTFAQRFRTKLGSNASAKQGAQGAKGATAASRRAPLKRDEVLPAVVERVRRETTTALRDNLRVRVNARRDGKPASTRAVSEAARVRAAPGSKHHDEVHASLALIDKVHTDGRLRAVPFHVRDEGAHGIYALNAGRAQYLALAPTTKLPRMTLVHEVGHWLDHEALGGKDFGTRARSGSRASRELADVKHTLEGTQEIRQMQQAKGDRRRKLESRRYLRYLTAPHEQFARAYAQWIALRSGDPRMLRELDVMRRNDAKGYLPPRQWTDESFAPVAAAFDRLFRQRGWLHA